MECTLLCLLAPFIFSLLSCSVSRQDIKQASLSLPVVSRQFAGKAFLGHKPWMCAPGALGESAHGHRELQPRAQQISHVQTQSPLSEKCFKIPDMAKPFTLTELLSCQPVASTGSILKLLCPMAMTRAAWLPHKPRRVCVCAHPFAVL